MFLTIHFEEFNLVQKKQLVHDLFSLASTLSFSENHRKPRRTVSEINLQTTEPNMHVKLQAKLTAKKSKYLSNSSK